MRYWTMIICKKATKFDSTNSTIQKFLTANDKCYFMGDFTLGSGYNCDADNSYNSFILNLKKKPTDPYQRYKISAMQKATSCLKAALKLSHFVSDITLVPMPSSKADEDALYDDRMLQVLLDLRQYNPKLSIEDILHTPVSRDSLHDGGQRDPDILEIKFSMRDSSPPLNNTILLVDDVITSGASFIACKRIIQRKYPDKSVKGLFLSRAVSAEPDFDFDL